jgi:hypothetical protein
MSAVGNLGSARGNDGRVVYADGLRTAGGNGRAGSVNGYRQLVASVILLAIRDYRKGRRCELGYGKCREGAHRCKRDAQEFLESERCAGLLLALDVDPERVRRRLGLEIPRTRDNGRKGGVGEWQ